jgi:kumamolisin
LVNQTFLPVEVVPAGSSTTPGTEASLDIAMALSMAPQAQVVAFVGGPSEILANMADRDDVKQFSSSWFWYGSKSDAALMLELGVQGQSFLQASGDSGPYPAGMFSTYADGTLDCRMFPAITIVGGSSLASADGGGSNAAVETAWTRGSGGVEASLPIPSYQSGIAGSNGASASERNVPDVAAHAGGGYMVFKGQVSNGDGTGQSAALWAGFMALVNELAAHNGEASVGFANPALYAIASTNA